MSQLTQCVECGNPVSSDLHKCPHCGKNPQNVICHICLNPMKESESIPLHTSPTDSSLDLIEDKNGGMLTSWYRGLGRSHVHKSCLNDIKISINSQKTIACPVCNHSHPIKDFYFSDSYKIQYKHQISCKNCGHHFTHELSAGEQIYDICTYCELPVKKSSAVKTYFGLAHSSCFTHERQEISKGFVNLECVRQEYFDKTYKNVQALPTWLSDFFSNIYLIILSYGTHVGLPICGLLFVVYLLTGGRTGNLALLILFALFMLIINIVDWQKRKPKYQVKPISNPSDILKLPKGDLATIRVKLYLNRNRRDERYIASYEIDFDNEILLDFINYKCQVKQASTQAGAISSMAWLFDATDVQFLTRTFLKLRAKKLYYSRLDLNEFS